MGKLYLCRHHVRFADFTAIPGEVVEAELTETGGGKFPAPLVHAMLMLAAHWYNQRESVSATQMYAVPDSLQALIKPYRRLAD